MARQATGQGVRAMRWTVVAMFGALALGGCSFGADVPVAEKAIAAFHAQLDAAQFDPIYAGSAQEMKSSTTEARLTALLAAVHRKLGLFKSGKSLGWNENLNPGGHFMTINYQAVYERGPAAENFVYRIDNGKATLAGYHVNADALVLN
jgi:hypothetical protein